MDKKCVKASVIKADGEKRIVRFRASTAAVDRHGTIVNPEGIDTDNFEKNPIFLWGHDGYGGFSAPEIENVIGKVVGYSRTNEAFDIDVEFAPGEANEKAEMALQLVKGGFLNAVSVGFYPTQMGMKKLEDGSNVEVYEKSELLEVSLVPIPSNPEAIALARSMGDAIQMKETPFQKFMSQQLRQVEDNIWGEGKAKKVSTPRAEASDTGVDKTNLSDVLKGIKQGVADVLGDTDNHIKNER